MYASFGNWKSSLSAYGAEAICHFESESNFRLKNIPNNAELF